VRKEEKLNVHLHKEKEEKETAIQHLQQDLQASQASCGQLYSETRQLHSKLEEAKKEEERHIHDLEMINESLKQKLGQQDDLYKAVTDQLDTLRQK
jgi:hypothetical protein